jgi:hypothetical protein
MLNLTHLKLLLNLQPSRVELDVESNSSQIKNISNSTSNNNSNQSLRISIVTRMEPLSLYAAYEGLG